MRDRTAIEPFVIPAYSLRDSTRRLLRDPVSSFPQPDLLIGAGHRTHIPMLLARRLRGGKTVVLMKPSLPLRWFDFRLIPSHDGVAEVLPHTIVTQGALNTVTPAKQRDAALGLLLIGGPSRHYGWDENALMSQLRRILGSTGGVNWLVTDSRRTPPGTSALLQSLPAGASFISHRDTPPDWLEQQLTRAGSVWVSEDSVSMMYEALTSGAAVGLLPLPLTRTGRVARAIADLAGADRITHYRDWLEGKPLAKAEEALHESRRCAGLLLDALRK